MKMSLILLFRNVGSGLVLSSPAVRCPQAGTAIPSRCSSSARQRAAISRAKKEITIRLPHQYMRHLVFFDDVLRARRHALQPGAFSEVTRARLKFDVIVVVGVARITHHLDLIANLGQPLAAR